MNNINRVLLVAVISLWSLGANAQAQFGIRGGLNFSNQLEKDDNQTYSSDNSARVGFNAAVLLDYRIWDIFSVETSVMMSTKGFTRNTTTGLTNTETLVKLLYLDIPINAKVTLGLGSNFSVFGAVGPNFGIGMSGTSESTTTIANITSSTDSAIEWGQDELNDDLNKLDVGLTAGGGIGIKSFQIGGYYDFSLLNVSPRSKNGYRVKNQVFRFSVAYLFGE